MPAVALVVLSSQENVLYFVEESQTYRGTSEECAETKAECVEEAGPNHARSSVFEFCACKKPQWKAIPTGTPLPRRSCWPHRSSFPMICLSCRQSSPSEQPPRLLAGSPGHGSIEINYKILVTSSIQESFSRLGAW